MNGGLCMASLRVKPGQGIRLPRSVSVVFKSDSMGLFKPDLFRSLAFGFLMGTAVMAMSVGATAWASADSAPVTNSGTSHATGQTGR